MGEPPTSGDPADTTDADDAVRVSRLDGVDAGHALLFRGLSPRQKALRALMVAVPMLVILALVLGVPAALGAWFAARGVAPTTAVSVASFAPRVATIPLPADAISPQQLSVAALEQGWLAICWMKLAQVDGHQALEPEVAVTYDGGASWREIAIPGVTNALNCSLVASTDEPSVLAVLGHLDAQGGGCVEPTLEMLDVGALSWQAVPWPTAACENTFVNSGFPATGPSLALVGTRVYAWNATGLLSPDAVNHAGRILETDDHGQSWRALDASFDPTALVSLVGAQQSGQLLAETQSADGTTDTLWQTGDDGDHWENRGKLPGANARVYVATNAGEDGLGDWGRLYVRYDPLRGGVPTSGSPMLATSTLGQAWRAVALPPGPPQAAPTSGAPVLTSLVVGPGDTLILTDYRAQGAGHPITYQPQNVWRWDPSDGIWTLASTAIPANASLAALSWQGNTLMYWVVISSGSESDLVFTLQGIQIA